MSGEMNTTLDGETNQSSFETNKQQQSSVPSGHQSTTLHHKVPNSCTNENLFTNDSNEKRDDIVNSCDQDMSPVEGPVAEVPIFDKHLEPGDKQRGDAGDGCEEFSGQIVYNPDGSAYIIDESDESLLEQIPKQEGSIVERAGKCLPEAEYPRIDQVSEDVKEKHSAFNQYKAHDFK